MQHPIDVVRRLLDLLRVPAQAATCRGEAWDDLIRIARMCGLSAMLGIRLRQAGQLEAVPPDIRDHLTSACLAARHRAQMVWWELHELAQALVPLGVPVVLLKGAAYQLAAIEPLASGRFVSDVDLLVPKASLQEVEQCLHEAGWKSADLNPYDERYYRDWSHEVPPLRADGRPLEVDLHHGITPGRLARGIDAASLFAASRALPGSPFRVLAPVDQVLHACIHCFCDGDLSLRLREVVDIHFLVEAHRDGQDFWPDLVRRAKQFRAERALWYGLRYAAQWMGLAVPDEVASDLRGPMMPAAWAMDVLVQTAMWPSDPDRFSSPGHHLAAGLLLARHHLIRMPVRRLVPHLVTKAAARARWRFAAP